jgi:lipid-A-disaccharide synthase
MSNHIFMLAGEASGDKLGGLIIEEINDRGFASRITGVGGNDMLSQGLEPLFPMQELTVMGIAGAIRNYRHLKNRIKLLVDHLRDAKPQLILTIDSKAFSLRLGRTLKDVMAKEGWSVPVIHLVAPTVWAWGEWRAKNIPSSVDHLLCLFPFEIPYFTKYGASAFAVGHPATDIDWPDRASARKSLSLGKNDFVLGLFPGSRRSELGNLLPDMCVAATRLRDLYPDIKIILPAVGSIRHLIDEFLTPEDGIEVVDEDMRFHVMRAADFGIICSGTVTLETALAGLEGSVYYRGDPLSTFIFKFLVDMSKVVLPNAITGHEIYPLYLNKNFDGDQMAQQVTASMADDMPASDRQSKKLKTALMPHDVSGKGGTSFQQNVVDRLDNILNVF